MLQDSVLASSVVTDSRSGVMHLEFSVLHRSVDAMSAVAGLSGSVPKECIATRFREFSRFRDSLGVIREGGSGDRKVVCAGPYTRGVTAPRACSDAGVGGWGIQSRREPRKTRSACPQNPL